jgi:hypothetical protein
MRDDIYNEGFYAAGRVGGGRFGTGRGAWTAAGSDRVAPCEAQVGVARLQLAEFERSLRLHAGLDDLDDLLEATRVLGEQLDRDQPSEVVVQGVLDRIASRTAPVTALVKATAALTRSLRPLFS